MMVSLIMAKRNESSKRTQKNERTLLKRLKNIRL